MAKNLVVMVLLVLQLMVTFTSTAHHEAKDLGAAAANFFEVNNSPVKPNVVQMPEPPHEHSDDEDETGNDFVGVVMNEEDTDGDVQFGDGHNPFEDDIDGDDINFDDVFMADGDIDLIDMDLEKHLQMHQGHDADQEHNEDIHKLLFPHLLTDGDDINKTIMGNMAPKKKQNMAPKKKQIVAPKKKHMASTKIPHPTLQKVHAQESSRYPTYETKPTYDPKAYNEYYTYDTTATYDPQMYVAYDKPTYSPEAHDTYDTSKYDPQAHDTYGTSKYATQAHDTYGTSKYVSQAHDTYDTSKYEPQAHDTSTYGQGYNEAASALGNRIRYVPVMQVQKKNDYKQHSHGKYKNRYPKKYRAVQSKYYHSL